MSRPFGFSGASQRTACSLMEGRWPAPCWLTRTRACLCASASTARECCSPAGSLTSLLKEKERGQVGLRHCSQHSELPDSLTPFPTVFHNAQEILIDRVPSLYPWAVGQGCVSGVSALAQIFIITDATVELWFSLSMENKFCVDGLCSFPPHIVYSKSQLLN